MELVERKKRALKGLFKGSKRARRGESVLLSAQQGLHALPEALQRDVAVLPHAAGRYEDDVDSDV